jgi:XTP/dITP diphosphohydrolase
MDLLLATRNVNKTREFAQILGNDFRITDLSNLENCVELEESGRTFGENASLKALTVSQSVDRTGLVVADDSGLEVDALGGAPGIFSARYAGHNASDRENIDKLLTELSSRRAPSKERSARFRCVIALAQGGKILGTFEGAVEGMIVEHPRGDSGFGYDPIFLPDGLNKTFGELSAEAKNKISHRGKALSALCEFLRERETNRDSED